MNTKALFESFRQMSENSLERCMGDLEHVREISEKDLARCFENAALAALEWDDLPNAEADGLTPGAFFAGIQDIDRLISMFRECAILCDGEIPLSLRERLAALDCEGRVFDRIADMATDRSLLGNETGEMILVAAIDFLGEAQATKAIEPLALFACGIERTQPSHDLVCEHVAAAFVQMGCDAVEQLMDQLSQGGALFDRKDFFLPSLALAGAGCTNDRLYSFLKESFAGAEDKTAAAESLGMFGDGRAVAFLRGYAERNLETITPELFYEIRLSIERLGGQMKDLDAEFVSQRGRDRNQ